MLADTRCWSAGKEDKMDGYLFMGCMGKLEELVSHALLPNRGVQVTAAQSTQLF